MSAQKNMFNDTEEEDNYPLSFGSVDPMMLEATASPIFR